ncbi:MAG: PilZ domain-containing protein [Lentisphaerae bacterium]|nr:PilZ domain-containing protein [Lentisphaerota bacterium]
MKESGTDRRQFIRHPSGIPIQCSTKGQSDESVEQLRDISHGGMAFTSGCCYDTGTILQVQYPSLQHPETLEGEIIWSYRIDDEGYVNGLKFLDERTHFRARLVEQICYIEAYHRRETEKGRELTLHEAALEWVAEYAGTFPD